MSVHCALGARRRMINVLRTHRQEKRLIDLTATVEVTDEAMAWIEAIRSDLPYDAIAYPSSDARWYWRDRPALFIYPSPVKLDFVLTSQTTGKEFDILDRPKLDEQLIAAHWVLPPQLYDHPKAITANGIITDPALVAELAERVAGFGLSLAIDLEDALTSGHIPWGDGAHANPDFDGGRIGTDTLHVAAMIRAVAAGALIVDEPRMTRPERRAIQRVGVPYFHLDIPHIGSTLAGRNPAVLKHRQHYTRFGEVKKALSHDVADRLVADNPGLAKYVCEFCRKIHVGNER